MTYRNGHFRKGVPVFALSCSAGGGNILTAMKYALHAAALIATLAS
ncbi:MAG: hypothetical protein JWL97_2211, partial [Gemmatimonadales bacterium]|nr:hypothetical protein [Gemmatimonadales bacterium]